MLFSKKAEYACVAMLDLAVRHQSPQPVRLKAIADANEIPDRFLVQIMLQLKGAGLVLSTRGASGGYLLATPPDKISLASIIDVIDRTDPPPPETVSPTASILVRTIREAWGDILQAQRRILETTTLADLVRRSETVNDFAYQI
ncbi:RrF2 family transcriptional regulator [Tuwongella immobilis]|uniref:Rrf2 family transcriptional regulator n=1 Tax=Tuwongella immobilis TaxID=692036 RepID=A0A6C2YJ73_9BACT|nr:Rrf2 family transcriptional regulator [Tuwongella immobilis]VIP01331.1 Transcriptional regulator, BadM/Rrf2 family OS=Pirellula staleyi (strain ATCC 27377 / DSM 6068 / ICPB 4128) GN=Psta_0335 PE=4 SV=1: Rrf2 [Tuwongella immobilis]VTR98088.1 Transcriptional regulator, BadM/Rrf2 family OS=Pirellula staleyi (strain ATCC 27377 / DSM 6068 / ICPB 4128) GN=Psta_0335 PE=4 SV=1: Rrf2 [Tuwongella immobilis]